MNGLNLKIINDLPMEMSSEIALTQQNQVKFLLIESTDDG